MKVFIVGNSLFTPEWSSLLGDKYCNALSFSWEFTDQLEEAQVIVWDGMQNAKSSQEFRRIQEVLKQDGHLLILQREAFTLFKEHPYVEFIDLEQIRYLELSGNIVPEDLLEALDSCHKKLKNV